MLYSEADFVTSREATRKEAALMLLCALPFGVLAAVGFALRVEILCMAGCFLFGAVMIYLWDMRLGPKLRYGRFLKEATSGLTRRTAGTITRLGKERFFEDGVWFYELILNIYEDLSEEGERRYLYDAAKPRPEEFVGRDVALTSHGSIVLGVEALGEGHETGKA